MPEDAATKVCPLCAETIKAAAKICPHCRKAQNRWLLFISRFDLLAMLAILVFFGAAYWLILIFSGERTFSKYRDQIVVLSSSFNVYKSESWTNLVVSGVLTNKSDYTWQIWQLEVRCFGTNGALGDVVEIRGPNEFEVLPHADHSYHLEAYNRTSIPDFPSYKVVVTSARDPKDRDIFSEYEY